MNSNRHLVFTYGSLKSGFGNHSCIEGDNTTLLGEGRTQDTSFLMASYRVYPAVKRFVSDEAFAIAGELYEVDDEVLECLDMLESNGRFYQRELVNIVLDDEDMENPVVQAWMYLSLLALPKNWDGIEQTEDDVLFWVGRAFPTFAT